MTKKHTITLPTEHSFGALEPVFFFYGSMPTGVTITETRRCFVCFPNWDNQPPYCAVAEIKNGSLYSYPPDCKEPLISVQSVVADGNGSLWILDTAAPHFTAPVLHQAKLIKIDLLHNKIDRIYTFPDHVVLPTTYLNDVRFDFRVGESGYAYLTDSSIYGPGAIIVLNLYTGEAVRKLNGHFSTSPDLNFIAKVEGKPLFNRYENGNASPYHVSVDGIALSSCGTTLFYSPLTSRNLYRICTSILREPDVNADSFSTFVIEKGASDGMITDLEDTIYFGDYENNSIRKLTNNMELETIAYHPSILWPDTFSIGPDQYLYFIVNQLHRQPNFHKGVDLRQRPFVLFRLHISALPARTF